MRMLDGDTAIRSGALEKATRRSAAASAGSRHLTNVTLPDALLHDTCERGLVTKVAAVHHSAGCDVAARGQGVAPITELKPGPRDQGKAPRAGDTGVECNAGQGAGARGRVSRCAP